jgi:C_GCAxxG_C_C family probable redox protein
VLDLKDDNILKAASGLHGGIGGMQDTCGALLGASMMLGLKYGQSREELDNPDESGSSTIQVGKLYKWFEKEFGTVKCREISTRFAGGVHYDLNIPWQSELAREAGMYEKCDELAGKIAARTAEMLWDTMEAEKKK